MTTTLTQGADTAVITDGSYLAVIDVTNWDLAGPGRQLAVQRYASDGTPIGNPVYLSTGVEAQTGVVHITALADGSYWVAWTNDYYDYDFHSYTGSSVFARHIGANNQEIGSGFGSNLGDASSSYGPYVTVLDNGNAVLSVTAWSGGPYTSVVLLSPQGTVISGTYTDDTADIQAKYVTAIAGGGYVVNWGSSVEVYDANGNSVAGPFDADSDNPEAGVAAVAPAGDGFILLAGDHLVVYDGDANRLVRSDAWTDAASASHVTLAKLDNGDLLVVWSTAGNGLDIMAQRFDTAGHALGWAFTVTNYTAGDQYPLGVDAAAGGGFVVTWDGDAADGYGVHRTAFNAGGSLSSNNYLFGTWGPDVLNGGTGTDVLAGGVGNDTYYIDNAGDQVQENADAGTDLVKASVNWILGANLEDLVLTGSGSINGYGNGLDNHITGNSGANILSGGDGNDVLNGAAGNDSMYGGAGDDAYYVDSLGDRVDESLGGGTDTVRSSVDFSLSVGLENLSLTGTGDLRGFGNDLNNVINGNGGANAMAGRGGNDVLNGGGGADRLYGGVGDDIFYVDDTGDRVYETAGEGYDRVFSSVSFGVNSQSIEYLILTGTADVDASGNTGNDRLLGNSGANTLKGADGDDRLDGGAGSDTLIGGRGADMFVFGLNSGVDTINDFHASENDRIDLRAWASASVTQIGADTVIDLGGGNVVTVWHANLADVTSHILWGS